MNGPPQCEGTDIPRRATREAPLLSSGHQWWAPPLRVAILLASDLAALAGCALLAYILWARPVHHQSLAIYRPLFPLIMLFPLSYLHAGLYPGFGLGAVETFRRLSTRTSFIYLAIAAMTFVLKLPQLFSRMMFVIALILSVIAVPLLRYVVLGVVRHRRWWAEPVVVVGQGQVIRQLLHTLHEAYSIGYRPAAELLLQPETQPGAPQLLPIAGTLADAPAVAARGFRIALVPEDPQGQHWKLVELLHQYFRHVIVIRSLGGTPVLGVHVRNFGGVLGLEFTNELLKRHNRILKRATDLALGSLALLPATPLVALAAAAVQIFSRGPVFFSQEREGLYGRRIRVWKLRTMVPDAEERLDKHLMANADARKEWEQGFKLRHDPRLVPIVGGVLRRFSIDELPQLVNVLRGDMSLVGPRPFPPYHLKRFSPGFRRLRNQVRPGMTGLWQVLGRSTGGLGDQEALDTHYIRNWSLWMDLYILGKTVSAVLGGRGAY
ncbi:MAG: exopolysaccharide biosynthesis polyprenyl glycosylphosphotransferase [Acidobacteria bacterium]|nr:exopolysaccharide biosynthesis polyprenyl glycosylphosphotransferase [Acidobacteriota bacterium]